MDEFPPLPPSPGDSSRRPTQAPVPVAFDHRLPRTIGEDTATLPPGCVQIAYVIESRNSPSKPWEMRPSTEHRGGRSWNRHFLRINRIGGMWHYNALAFSDRKTALECAASLFDMRYDVKTRFRVVEIRVTLETSVVPCWTQDH